MTGSSKIHVNGIFSKSIETPFIVAARAALHAAEPAICSLWESVQESAGRSLAEKSIPTGRTEDWRYVSLVPLHEKKLQMAEAVLVLERQLEHVNFCRFSEAVAGRGEEWGRALLARHESVLADGDGSTFISINRALTCDPWVLWIDDGATVVEPIELSWKSAGSGWLGYGRLLIDIPDRSQADVVERYGKAADALIVETSLSIGDSAICEYLRIQEGDKASVVLTSPSVRIGRAGHCRLIQVSTGSRIGREDLQVDLVAEGAEIHLDGLYVARDQQTIDNHTVVRHQIGSTVSRQIYKGILSDEARGVFNGRIEIARGASGSNSSQINKNLMLSRKAEIDTKPELRIDNDDVKAAHGATIGRLDPEHVFYLRSRGLTEGQAVDLLSRGFALDVLDRVKSPILRSQGYEFLSSQLSGLNWEMA